MIKQYLQITKPGIIFGNLISVISGFLLAAKGHINYILLINTVISMSLIIASSCVLNNYIDRDIDQKMERTKNRVLVKKLISPRKSLIYAVILGISGFTLLYLNANQSAILLAIIGFIIYVIVYSLYMKRKSVYSNLIGSLSGAIPPVIGYCIVNNKLDIGALILLVIFIMWQMPHTYAIAIFRFRDYQAASIPTLPIKRGILVTKHHITFYIIMFISASMMLTFSGYTGYNYLIISSLVNISWLSIALQGYKPMNNDIEWSRRIFTFSIIAIFSINAMMSIDFIAPSVSTYTYLL